MLLQTTIDNNCAPIRIFLVLTPVIGIGFVMHLRGLASANGLRLLWKGASENDQIKFPPTAFTVVQEPQRAFNFLFGGGGGGGGGDGRRCFAPRRCVLHEEARNNQSAREVELLSFGPTWEKRSPAYSTLVTRRLVISPILDTSPP